MKHILKLFSFAPAILMMYIIFNFSSAEGVDSAALSYTVSYKVVEFVDEAGDFEWTYDQKYYYAEQIHGRIRKCAHMAEYAVLAVCVSFPLYVYGLHGILLMILAGGICVAFACSDEYHQLFVAGRSGAVRDVIIDSIGIFAGIIVVRIIGFTGRMTIFRPWSKKSKRALRKQKKKQMRREARRRGFLPDPDVEYDDYGPVKRTGRTKSYLSHILDEPEDDPVEEVIEEIPEVPTEEVVEEGPYVGRRRRRPSGQTQERHGNQEFYE